MVLDRVLSLHVARHSRLDEILARNTHHAIGNGERGVDPAVGVHHVQRDLVHDAVDGIADVLATGDEQREGDQDDYRRLVVQPEDVVVYADRV